MQEFVIDFLVGRGRRSHEINCARNVASIRQKQAAGVDLREFYFRPQPSGKYLLGLLSGATHKKIQTVPPCLLRLFFCAEMGTSAADLSVILLRCLLHACCQVEAARIQLP